MKQFFVVTTVILFIFSINSCGQTSQDPRTKLLADIKQRAGKNEFLNDTSSLRTYAEQFGDSVLVQLDNFLKDSIDSKRLKSFKVKIGKYKIQDPRSQIGWVNDYEEIFSDLEQRDLKDIIVKLFSQTSFDVVVVSIDATLLKENSFNQLIDSIHDGWCQDYQKETFVVLGVSASLQKAAISVSPQLKKKLSDVQADQIIKELILPEFKNRRYFEGAKSGLLKIIEMLK